MIDIQLIGLFNATLQAATLLFIAALGELITEKSGILNLGVEGMISVGAVTGFMTAVNTENIFLAVLVGVLSSSAFASIHALVTVILKQDQTVSGLILTILGLALSWVLAWLIQFRWQGLEACLLRTPTYHLMPVSYTHLTLPTTPYV